MYISNQLLRACLLVTGLGWLACCSAVDGGFVVKTVKIASSLFEVVDPFLWLLCQSAFVRQVLPASVDLVIPLQSSYGSQTFLWPWLEMACQHAAGSWSLPERQRSCSVQSGRPLCLHAASLLLGRLCLSMPFLERQSPRTELKGL